MKSTRLNRLIRAFALVVATKLLPLLLLTLPDVAQAEDFTYTTNDDGTITITGYSGPGGAVIIPDRINGLPVTSIGEWAFYNCSNLVNVTIPNSVVTIEDGAFWVCTGLTSVTIGNSVTSIGTWAFGYCTSLTSITIPASVNSMGDWALESCPNLSKVYFLGNAPSAPLVFYGEDHATVYYLLGTTGWGPMFGGRPTAVWNPQAPYICTTNNGTITITGYTGPGGAVTVPSMINGLPVIGIGGYAFSHDTTLTSITMSNSVTSIGDGAFYSCTHLTMITVDAANPSFSTVAGVLFNKSQTTLIQYPGGKAGAYTIPNSVISIWWAAFHSCSSLTSVTIPNTVSTIADTAFAGCSGITSVIIPNSVTGIGDSAFEGCSSLISAMIPNSVTSIGDGAFGGCSSLTSIMIPDSVTSIGNASFGSCSSLTDVTIPNSVTRIGSQEFYSCTGLTNVTIGNSVASIGTAAFEGCTSLRTITVATANSSFSSVAGVLFNKSQTTLLACPEDKAGSYTIPSSVTTIEDSAFFSCISLSSVTIPNSVTSIASTAFAGCSSLMGAYFQGNAPSADQTVFSGDDHATVYYLSGTTGWGSTFGGCPTFMVYPMHPPYQVTNTLDDGPSSLRQAILNANANGGGDIVFPSVSGTTAPLSPLPSITANVTIMGLGPSSNVISGSGLFRVFDFTVGTTCVLSGLTIRDGRNCSCDSPDYGSGGGIRNRGDLIIRNCEIITNGGYHFDGDGGGIASDGMLMLDGVTVAGNTCYGFGGGVYSTGKLIVTNCDITDNWASDRGGGGIASFGTLVAYNTALRDNVSFYTGPGGGIYAQGDVVLTNCTIASNLCDSSSGGIWFYGNNLYILGSVIRNNSSPLSAFGGVLAHGTNILIVNSSIVDNMCATIAGGIGFWDSTTHATVINCTISGNKMSSYYNGGAAIINQGTLNLIDCTISGNGHPGKYSAAEPSIFNDGILSALHCTIAFNEGGVTNSGTFNAQNTIIAKNGTNFDFSGALTSQGFNLIGNVTETIVIGDTTGNIYGVDPLLGPLQDNGGPTLTCTLLPGSPALNAGTAVGAPSTDQRGAPRPVGPGVDIGAFEFQYSVPLLTSISLPTLNTIRLQCIGMPSAVYTLQGSTNLVDWVDITPILTRTNGVWELTGGGVSRYSQRFYRLALQPSEDSVYIPATSGVITAPFLVTNGFIYQPIETTVADGGRAAYGFTLSNAGTYVINAVVSAPDGGANSFYVNIDAEPQDPYMVWDVPVTWGFVQETVSWRGDEAPGNTEFAPKVFTLKQGGHQIIVRGRESFTLLESLTITPYP